MTRPSQRYAAEREHARKMAGPLVNLLEEAADALHYNESLHMHDSGSRTPCGYCYLRTGRVLGLVAMRAGGRR